MIIQHLAAISNIVLFFGFIFLICPILFVLFYKAHQWGFTSVFKNKS